MSTQTLSKRPSGFLRMPGSLSTKFRPNRVCGSKPCVGSTFLAYAVLQTPGITEIRSLAILHCPAQVHSATTMHRLDTQKICRLSTLGDEDDSHSTWEEVYPKQNDIKVKSKGKNADWESLKAIVSVHRDSRRRARRVWTPLSGDEPTREELAMRWPKNKQAIRIRKLRDEEELSSDEPFGSWDPQDGKQFYMVTEKLDVDGRRFWREVIPKKGCTAEEDEASWHELMEEEGWWDEIDRQIKKD